MLVFKLSVALFFLLSILSETNRKPAAPPVAPAPVETTATTTEAAPSEPTTTEAAVPAKPAAAEARLPGTYALFEEPVESARYEVPSSALATWRGFASRKPALLLFSKHPFLDPLADNLREDVRALLSNGTAEDINRRGRLRAADPVFFPPNTVSAAIEGRLISELVYVYPTSRPVAEFSLPDFQRRALGAGFLTEAEALALTLQDGVISGTVRGIPFRCVHPEALPKIDAPVLVHIDLGYFESLYANDIKTPVYGLIYDLSKALRAAAYPVLAVSLSYSNQETGFSLDSRFIISDLAELLRHPEWLTQEVPASWTLRSQALFASTMFAESTSLELTAEAAQINPDDPAALYHQALVLFRQEQPDEAFVLLDQAVALDAGYALAYIDLAETGLESGQWEKALELLGKAAQHFPDDPFIRMRQADILIRHDRGQEALPLLRDLRQLPWSPVHYYGIPGYLKEMQAAAEGQTGKTP